MSEGAHENAQDLDGQPDPASVAKRAEDRPPEEGTSQSPMTQAQIILEESEQRMADGAMDSAPPKP